MRFVGGNINSYPLIPPTTVSPELPSPYPITFICHLIYRWSFIGVFTTHLANRFDDTLNGLAFLDTGATCRS